MIFLHLLVACNSNYYRKIIKANKNFSSYVGKPFIVESKTEIRDKKTTSSKLQFFNFYYSNNNLCLLTTWEHAYWNTIITNDSIHQFFLDSANNKMELKFKITKGSLIKGKIEPSYVSLSKLPNKKNQFFSVLKYTKPKIQKFDDTIILVQKIRGMFRERKIFADINTGLITKIEELNYDTNYIDDYTKTLFYYLHSDSFEYILKQKELGGFGKRTKPNNTSFQRSEIQNTEFIKCLNLTKNDSCQIENKYLILYYWYLSCLPCRKASPIVQEIAKLIISDRALVLGVNSIDSEIEIINYCKKYSYDFNQTQSSIMNKYNTGEYPCILIINKNGLIIKKFCGIYPGLQSELIQELNSLHLLVE